MIREVKFESQDRRIKQILAALNENGIKDIEEANAICEQYGLDPYKTCEETQPICFENAKCPCGYQFLPGRTNSQFSKSLERQ